MKTRSILVYVPGFPISWRALVPNRPLASLAACLRATGHETEVCDLGTVDVLRQFSGCARGAPSRRSARLGLGRAKHPTASALCRVAAGWAESVASETGFDFAVFTLEDRESAGSAVLFAQALRRALPGIRVGASGPGATLFAETLMQATDTFDFLCVGDAEAGIGMLAARIGAPETWVQVPNLIFRDGSLVRKTEQQTITDLSGLPCPDYSASAYPALAGDQKLKLFEVEHARGCGSRCFHCPHAGGPGSVHVKSAGRVCAEAESLRSEHGAQALTLVGAGASGAHVDALSRELLEGGLDISYTRCGQIHSAGSIDLGLLHASGCESMSFTISTGSQRLLDDYYGRGFGISDAERVLQACKDAGLHTVAHFTYPTPADDGHTRAETVRFVSRAKPGTVHAHAPRLVPGTAWSANSRAFGLKRRTVETGFHANAAPGTFAVKGWAPEREAFLEECRALNVATPEASGLELLALICRADPGARRVGDEISLALSNNGYEALAALVARANEHLCIPLNAVRFRPATRARAAVGD